MYYQQLPKKDLLSIIEEERKNFSEFQKLNLKLDISRGKPCKEQLDISMPLLDCFSMYKPKNPDYRNYGLPDGIAELKNLFAELCGVSENEVLVGGNSSLNMMYDTIQRALQFGADENGKAWNESKIKFLCPAPGYDRHFGICEAFNIEMVTVPMNEEGVDMDIVEELVSSDASIKGIWCVPKFSNPDGITYSNSVVDRLAAMKTAASDFRIFWDNAYFVHELYDEKVKLKNILQACKDAGNANRVYMFGSTSKITFPGSGVCFMVSSESNIARAKTQISVQTIGPNKMMQYAHYEFLKSPENVYKIMKKHADIIRPKFETFEYMMERAFPETDIVRWTKPKGGYFISVYVMNGCAKEVVKLCKELGLVLTPAGATYPYGMDDNDSNIRIAPTFTTEEELRSACEIFICCIKIAVIEKLLQRIDN